MMRWFLAGWAAWLLVVAPQDALCGEKSWGTTLVYVEGARAEEFLGEATRQVRDADKVGRVRPMGAEAWEKLGGKPLGMRPGGQKSREGAAAHLRSVAKKAGAQTVVFIHTARSGRTHNAWLFIVNQRRDQAVADEVVLVGKRSGKRVRWDTEDLLEEIEDVLDDAPPASSTSPRVASTPASVSTSSAPGGKAPWEMRERSVIVSTSWGFGKRKFRYSGEAAGALRESTVPSAMWDFSLELYPFAGNAVGFFPKLGLRARITKGVKSRSRFRDAGNNEVREVDNPWYEWDLGFVLKEVVGGNLNRRWGVGLDLGASFGQTVLGFTLPINDPRQREVPATLYNIGRVRLDLWVRRWYNNFRLYGAYLPVISGGSVADDLFPRAKVQGGEAGFEYMYLNPRFHGFAAVLNASYQAYFYDLNSIRGDARVADTARDQYVRVVVGGAFVLDAQH